eukprot:MONOS_514.1-p1 / transcript=MONOS_514.1 / gene=MONOS_514 / organism=Monocercomonoides_exilis_PA203 / gene_product=unspecified product / transcript_product=unspecified product / location=Mono_scaffold00008:119626-120946(+) / protein_length=346 / sequence_SO=supercontig / SO=protein_coding / is_pseudo=false
MLFQLGNLRDAERRQKIREMAGLVGGMSKKELGMVSKKEVFDEIEKMVGEKKISFEEVVPLMKQIGCWRMLNDKKNPNFYSSALCKRFELAIGEEEKKTEGKNEKWLSELCEWMEARICVDGLSGIIRRHEEHGNLTDVTCQTAWDLLVLQLKRKEAGLEDVIEGELHFAEETASELEELMGYVNWTEMEKEKEKKKKEKKRRKECRLCSKECVGLVGCVVQLDRTTKFCEEDMFLNYIEKVEFLMRLESVLIAVLVGGGAVDIDLEGLSQPTLEYLATEHCLGFVSKMLKKLRERTNSDEESTRRWACEKLESEGCEEMILCFMKSFCCKLNGSSVECMDNYVF